MCDGSRDRDIRLDHWETTTTVSAVIDGLPVARDEEQDIVRVRDLE